MTILKKLSIGALAALGVYALKNKGKGAKRAAAARSKAGEPDGVQTKRQPRKRRKRPHAKRARSA